MDKNDYVVLLEGIFPEQLPPLLEGLITEKSVEALIEEIKNNATDKLFTVSKRTNLLKKFKKEIKSPEYIYGNNWATESIKFFTFKSNGELRPLAIPNIKQGLMFAINSKYLADVVLEEIYSSKERINGKTSHSESPIIGRDGLFTSIFYEDDEVLMEEDDAIGFIGYTDTNKFFRENKLQRFNIEDTHPYILQLDLSNFFENVYTHMLAQIKIEHISPSGYDDSKGLLKEYLTWLDEYNQKVNDNHTKGIIQGSIS